MICTVCWLRACRYDVHALALLGVAAFTNSPWAVLLQPGSSLVLRARDTLTGQEYLLPALPAATAETAVYTEANPVPGDSDAPAAAAAGVAAVAAAAAAVPYVIGSAAPTALVSPPLPAGNEVGASVATDMAAAIPRAKAAAAQAAQAAARTAARAAAAAAASAEVAPQPPSAAATAPPELPGTATAAAAALAAAAAAQGGAAAVVPAPAAAPPAAPAEPQASPELAAAALAAARRYAVYTANSEPAVLNAHAHSPVCVYEVTFPRAGTLGLNLKTLTVPCGARSRSAEHCACLEVINVQSHFLTAVVQPRDVIVSVNGQSLRGGTFGAFSFEVSSCNFN
jgi:hypothetical protein